MSKYLVILLFPFPSNIVPFSLSRHQSVMTFATARTSLKRSELSFHSFLNLHFLEDVNIHWGNILRPIAKSGFCSLPLKAMSN